MESSLAWLVGPNEDGSYTLTPYTFGDGVYLHNYADNTAVLNDLREQLGWTNIQEQVTTCYTKYGVYPDVYYYYDGASTDRIVNPVTNMTTTYPTPLHGQVLVYRADPPRMSFGGDALPEITRPTILWTQQMGRGELEETLEFFQTRKFRDIDSLRAQKRIGVDRMMGGAPHFFI